MLVENLLEKRIVVHDRASPPPPWHLRCPQCQRFALFEDLFEVDRGPQVLVVTFIAMLELARERLLEITQAEAFAPIYVRLAYAPS